MTLDGVSFTGDEAAGGAGGKLGSFEGGGGMGGPGGGDGGGGFPGGGGGVGGADGTGSGGAGGFGGGDVSGVLPAGGHARYTLALTRSERRLLARRRHLTLVLRVIQTAQGHGTFIAARQVRFSAARRARKPVFTG